MISNFNEQQSKEITNLSTQILELIFEDRKIGIDTAIRSCLNTLVATLIMQNDLQAEIVTQEMKNKEIDPKKFNRELQANLDIYRSLMMTEIFEILLQNQNPKVRMLTMQKLLSNVLNRRSNNGKIIS